MKKKYNFYLIVLVFVLILLFIICSLTKESISYAVTDINLYEKVLGEKGEFKNNFGKYNNIFPNEIYENAKVEDFCYQYFNLADPCYMGYLVLAFDEKKDFDEECVRLKGLKSSKNAFIYDTTGFYYDTLAVYADDYYGYIYALADYENNQIIYVELQFCNGIMDIDYYEIIDKKHLPIGFDVYVEYEFLN